MSAVGLTMILEVLFSDAPEALDTRCGQCQAFIYHRKAALRVMSIKDAKFTCVYCVKLNEGGYDDARG